MSFPHSRKPNWKFNADEIRVVPRFEEILRILNEVGTVIDAASVEDIEGLAKPFYISRTDEG